jgi:hypothetical protein
LGYLRGLLIGHIDKQAVHLSKTTRLQQLSLLISYHAT